MKWFVMLEYMIVCDVFLKCVIMSDVKMYDDEWWCVRLKGVMACDVRMSDGVCC